MSKLSRPKLIRYLFLAAFCLLLLLLNVRLLDWIKTLSNDPLYFKEWILSYGSYSRIVYILLVILQIILAVLPGEPFEILGGYAFGAAEGTFLCLIGAAIGSFLVIFLVRRFGRKLLSLFFEEAEIARLNFLKNDPRRIYLLLLVFLVPGTPKDLLCYFAGLTDIPLGILYIIVSFARIPSIITSTLGGHYLGTSNYLFAFLVFLFSLLLALIGITVYQKLLKTKNNK